MKYFASVFIVAILLLACGGGEKSVSACDTLRVASGSPDSALTGIEAILEPTLADAGFGFTLFPGTRRQAMRALGTGDADLALMPLFMCRSSSGDSERFVEAHENIRAIGNLCPQYLYVLVHAGYACKHGISTFRELLGAAPLRLGLLPRGTAGGHLAIQAIQACGSGLASITMQGGVAQVDCELGLQRLVNGELDAFVCMLPAPSVYVRNACAMSELRILPFDGAIINQLQRQSGTTAHTLPAGMYSGLDEDIRVVGDYTCLLVSEDMADDTAYTLADAVFNNWRKQERVAIESPREHLDEIFSEEGFGLHESATRLVEEKTWGE